MNGGYTLGIDYSSDAASAAVAVDGETEESVALENNGTASMAECIDEALTWATDEFGGAPDIISIATDGTSRIDDQLDAIRESTGCIVDATVIPQRRSTDVEGMEPLEYSELRATQAAEKYYR